MGGGHLCAFIIKVLSLHLSRRLNDEYSLLQPFKLIEILPGIEIYIFELVVVESLRVRAVGGIKGGTNLREKDN